MKIDSKKDQIQKEAIESWLSADKIGTCEIATGIGKTFLALHALYTMPKDKTVTHLFLSESSLREHDVLQQIVKYNELFDKDVLNDYNLKFYCYQTTYKWEDQKFGLVIADEIHDSLTPAYSKFYFNNEYEAIIGLSATIQQKTEYEDGLTKGDLLNQVAPICFEYGLKKAQEEDTARQLQIYVVMHYLDENNKTIQAGNKKKRFMQTEKAAYDYWDKQVKKSWYIQDEKLKELKIRISSKKRSDILYNLPSKLDAAKKLLQGINGKTIIFGNSINALLQITPNVVSSRNTKKKNERILEAFESDKITNIGSFKKLKQGANLSDLSNCIMISYYSSQLDVIQRLGRLRKNGEIGNVFIFLTVATQEAVWFEKMIQKLELNNNIIYCPNVDFCLKKYNENS